MSCFKTFLQSSVTHCVCVCVAKVALFNRFESIAVYCRGSCLCLSNECASIDSLRGHYLPLLNISMEISFLERMIVARWLWFLKRYKYGKQSCPPRQDYSWSAVQQSVGHLSCRLCVPSHHFLINTFNATISLSDAVSRYVKITDYRNNCASS